MENVEYSVPETNPLGVMPRETEPMAIIALVLSFFVPLAGAILGHIARNKCIKTGNEGRGMSLAAVIVGWSLTALYVLYVIFVVVLVAITAVDTPAVV